MKIISKGNVARYCKPSSLDEEGNPSSSSFQRRPNSNEGYLSVYLLEFFKSRTEKENVGKAKRRMAKRLNLSKNGLCAILNIEQSSEYIMNEIKQLIRYKPRGLPHCGIFHDYDDLVISELLAECVQNQYRIEDIE